MTMILGLAPMDGITDTSCRYLTAKVFEKWNQDNELFLRTEFMNADGYCIRPWKLIRHMMTVSSGYKTIAQIYGGNEETLVKAAVDLEKKYSDIFWGIELNIGCPSPKVMAGGGGSGMLEDKKKTLEIMKNIRKNISMPFTIKTRSGINLEDKNKQMDFILEASNFCEIISIHGRTLKQSHSGEVDWNFIYDAKKKCNPDCKIIGNGGIKFFAENQEKLGNLDGMMIGQAAIGNPWIFVDHQPNNEEIMKTSLEWLDRVVACEMYFDENVDEEQNEKNPENAENYSFPMPSLAQIEKYMENLAEMVKKYEERKGYKMKSVLEFRKFLFNFVKGIPNSKEFKVEVAQIKDYGVLRERIVEFFGTP